MYRLYIYTCHTVLRFVSCAIPDPSQNKRDFNQGIDIGGLVAVPSAFGILTELFHSLRFSRRQRV